MEIKRHGKEVNILAYIERCRTIEGEIQFKTEAKITDIKKFCDSHRDLILTCDSQKMYNDAISRIVDLKNHLEKIKA